MDTHAIHGIGFTRAELAALLDVTSESRPWVRVSLGVHRIELECCDDARYMRVTQELDGDPLSLDEGTIIGMVSRSLLSDGHRLIQRTECERAFLSPEALERGEGRIVIYDVEREAVVTEASRGETVSTQQRFAFPAPERVTVSQTDPLPVQIGFVTGLTKLRAAARTEVCELVTAGRLSVRVESPSDGSVWQLEIKPVKPANPSSPVEDVVKMGREQARFEWAVVQ